MWTTLNMAVAKSGRPEAEAAYRRALEIRAKLAADHPKVPGYRNDVASCHTNLSVILRRLGRLAEARDGCDKAPADIACSLARRPLSGGTARHQRELGGAKMSTITTAAQGSPRAMTSV